MKVSELTGAALDWAVAKCEGISVEYVDDGITRCLLMQAGSRFNPTTKWAQGGPIIEREKLSLLLISKTGGWAARTEAYPPKYVQGDTPLIAAMRCFATSKLGDEIDVPQELLS
jgi:hypothetical protein